MTGFGDFSAILADLGPHRIGKSCLYLGALAKVNADASARLIRAGPDDPVYQWPVSPA